MAKLNKIDARIKDVLSTRCIACGRERGAKSIAYDDGFSAYCRVAEDCKSDSHINSVPNIIKRSGAVKLMTYAEALNTVLDKSLGKDAQRILEIRRKALYYRETRVEMIAMLLEIGHGNISDALRACVDFYYEQHPEMQQLIETHEGLQEFKEPVEPAITPAPRKPVAPAFVEGTNTNKDDSSDDDFDNEGAI